MPGSEDHTQFFGRIHIHGLTKSPNGEPSPVTLERWPSFPMPTRIMNRPLTSRDVGDLSPRSLTPMFEIEARVRFDTPEHERAESSGPDGSLGQGRAGLVYPIEVVSIIPMSQPRASDVTPPSLPSLCLKVASPGHARALAREAWFYEQLDANGLRGVVAPRSYGVFHASLGDGQSHNAISVDIPGYDYHEIASMPLFRQDGDEDDCYDTHKLYTARMREEDICEETGKRELSKCFLDDVKSSYTSSPWRTFSDSPESKTLTVLIMDQLGERLTVNALEQDWEEDIAPLFDHLVSLWFIHGDGRFPNVLRVPQHLRVECPLHKREHCWNFIDWENGAVLYQVEGTLNAVRWQRLDLLLYYRSHGGGKPISTESTGLLSLAEGPSDFD